MRKESIKYLPIRLMLLLTVLSNGLLSQQLIIDTFSYSQYDVYCEGIMVSEYLVPDTTFQRLNGRSPDEVKEHFKYQEYSYQLGYDKDGELYSFKDFEIQIGNDGFEFSYPQYSYSIRRKSLCENLKNAKLYSHKTKETFNIDSLHLTFETNEIKQFNLPADELKLCAFLDSKESEKSTMKIRIEPIMYPVNQEMCGSILTYFPVVEFRL